MYPTAPANRHPSAVSESKVAISFRYQRSCGKIKPPEKFIFALKAENVKTLRNKKERERKKYCVREKSVIYVKTMMDSRSHSQNILSNSTATFISRPIFISKITPKNVLCTRKNSVIFCAFFSTIEKFMTCDKSCAESRRTPSKTEVSTYVGNFSQCEK